MFRCYIGTGSSDIKEFDMLINLFKDCVGSKTGILIIITISFGLPSAVRSVSKAMHDSERTSSRWQNLDDECLIRILLSVKVTMWLLRSHLPVTMVIQTALLQSL